MPLIETKHLTYTYSQGTPFAHQALDDVNFSVEKGEFLGIIGHTGSGKSTLIQQLNGLLKPTSGQVLLDGVDIHSKGVRLRDVRFRVGLVFQYPEHQLFEETARKDIAFGPKNMGLSDTEVDERVREAARLVALPEELLDQSPFDMSGGQKRRVAIAGVIAMRPDVLMLDEPTAGLDPGGREQLLLQLQEYRRETGATVILVSHSMEDIARCVDRLIVLNDSKIVMDGAPECVFSQVEALDTMGLDVPEVTRVLLHLRRMGVSLPTGAYTVEQAAKLICELLEGGGKEC